MDGYILHIIASLLLLLIILKIVAAQYKRCPYNKAIVVYGKLPDNKTVKCIHSGGVFIIPLIQSYTLLSLDPMEIDVNIDNALSKDNKKVNMKTAFVFAISREPELMQNAAERFLGWKKEDIIKQVENIISGQLRLILASYFVEELYSDCKKLSDYIEKTVNAELNKIGLEVINVNIRDLADNSDRGREQAKKVIEEEIKKIKNIEENCN